MTPGTDGDSLETLETAFETVDVIQEIEGAGVTELVSHLDIPPSTVHGYLSTLRHGSYLVTEDDSDRVGVEFLNKGGYARSPGGLHTRRGASGAPRRADGRARAVRRRRERERVRHLHRDRGERRRSGRTAEKRIVLHNSSAGKSILAHLPEVRVDESLDRWGLPAFTPGTITDRSELSDELATVRERGVPCCRCAGPAPQRTLLGAFSLSGPSNRLKGDDFERELPDLILGLTNEVERDLSYL